ncbi:Ig-like domain-containing protein [Marinobacter salinisoli]|uniref:Ig-like domain-containing protein n=1 Tax=Marinobacter salinisoli TaxID=2769486 RepID=A0ABX7MVW7_9GAMM|nr:Ig-like domain-containing protein [Marinobacter salinisoli]QSP95534.1 Ig-like domain-containing protein [Marinobacter salinisoli]
MSASGQVTAVSDGVVFVNARKDEVLASRRVVVTTSGDSDGDGLPDDYERNNGLNPNDPVDAFEDADMDGLSNFEEFELGTDLNSADTDGDGIADGVEVEGGDQGIVTDPLAADSDGDGINDGLEIMMGWDPNDNTSGDLASAIDSISVQPEQLFLTYNSIDGETSAQLRVMAQMLDGSERDMTAQSNGTRYASSDITVANFGLNDGEIFAGTDGSAEIEVTLNGLSVTVPVQVEQFDPEALSAIAIPGYANNVDVQGDYAFVAAGEAGLKVVDTSDKRAPEIIGSMDTAGVAVDIKVRGNFAYIADESNGLVVAEISDPSNPIQYFVASTSGLALDLALQGDYAYVASSLGGLDIFNISDPFNVISVGTNQELANVKAVDISGQWLVALDHTAVSLFDVTDPESPVRVHTLNVGSVKNLALDNGLVHVAAYSSGWRTYRIDESTSQLVQVGGGGEIAPRDVAITDGFAFYSEQLFPNVTAFMNISDPEAPFFQDTINLSPFGDYAGTGIAVDNTHAYITEESYVVRKDYGRTGDTKLFIAQFRMMTDNNGVDPEVSLTSPADRSVVVEGERLILEASASDDIAVGRVEFLVDGESVGVDTSYPYTLPYTVPFGTRALVVSAVAMDLGGNASEASVHRLSVEPDSDRDGLGDNEEQVRWGTNPGVSDTDGDFLLDGEEVARGTDPTNADSDGDGLVDGQEVIDGTDPNNPDRTPPEVVETDPANAGTGFPENAPVIVRFSEALSLKSVRTANIQLLEDGVRQTPGSFQLLAGGSEIVFQPDGLLKDFTPYTFSIDTVRDTAGNPIEAPVELSFETGNTVDTARPVVQEISPAHRATGVPVNVRLSAVMNERINPATVTNDSFYVVDLSTGQRIPGVVDVLDDDQTLVFTPNAAFLVGRDHRINLRSGIQDLFGNSLSNRYFDFTTSFEPDAQAPQIVATTVSNNQTSVPLNGVLRVRFNEAVSNRSALEVRLTANGERVPVDRFRSSDQRIISLKPKTVLDPQTRYQLEIANVEDLSGNLLPEPRAIEFTTGSGSDTASGSLKTYSPASNASNVPLNAVVEFWLSERIDPVLFDTGRVYLHNQTENRRVAVDLSLLDDGRRVRMTPREPLKAGHQYDARLSYGTYLYDLSGNRVGYYNRFTFTTSASADEVAPEVVSHNLTEDLGSVALNAPVAVTVNEPLNSLCVKTDTVSLSDGVSTISGSVSLSSDRRTVVFTPSQVLDAQTAYTLTISGACDLSLQTLPDYTLSFTTGTSTDTSGPRVSSITPAHRSTDVPVDTTITVVFNEPIDARTIGRTIVRTSAGAISGSWSVSGATAVFTPANALPGGTKVDVQVRNVLDPVGNSGGYQYYDFRTELEFDTEKPRLISTVPEDGSVDVGPNQPIVLTFSESLNSGDINNSNFVVYSEGSVIRPSVYYSANAQTVTLRGSWPSGQLMSVVVTDNVRDLSGNRMDDTVSLFTSAVIDIDTGRPSVARQYPANGSSGVTAERVVLYTNEPMNEATLPGAFYVAQNGVLKEGSLSVSGAGQALVFTPTEPFAENALIHVYLDSTARDDSGNRVNSYQGSFRTASTTTAGVWPKPTGYSPYGNQNGVVVNPKIQVRYDQPLEPSSVVGQVSLRNSDTGSVIPSTISVVGDGYVLQVEPEVLLESDTRYYISLGSDITDTDGDRQVYGYSSYFYTGADNVEDDQAPQVIALSPPDGSLDVPLNPLYHVRYDEPVNTLSFPRQPGMGVRFAAGNREVLYYYHEPLEADSTHQEVVPEVVDLAGNAAQPAETVFHVGMQPDVHAPGYSYFVPSSNETVPVNSTIRIVMNEVVDPVSVTNGRVYVEDTDNGWRRVPGQVGLEPDGRTLVWTPDEALLVSRRYYLRVNDIADLSDNKSSSTGFYFNTSAQADVEAPEIVETTVFEGQAGVPVNARIRVRFNEPVDRLSLEQITLRQSGQALPIQRYISNDRRIVTLVPKELLPAQTALLFTIDGVQDLAGNALVAPHTVGFVTESGVDVREGSLKTYSPVSNASNVPLNAVVEFWLSERIDPVLFDTGRVYLHNQTENRRVAVDLSLLDDGRRVRMTPREPLKAGHQYDARLSYGTYLYDLSGNRVGYYNRFTFTTSASADEVAPEVVSHNLTEDLGSVALNAPVAVTVNEPLNSLCVKTDTVSLSDGVSTISGSVSLSSDRRTVVFTPSQVLDAQTAYTLTISGACDLSLQTLPDYTLSFTTGTSTDTSGPRVSSITPAHRSTDVPVDTTITVVFNEPIDARTIGRTIVRTSAGAISGSWSVSGATAVFTPANALPGGTKVDVQVRNVLDPVGNSGGYQYYDFRTELEFDTEKPRLISTVPEDGSVDVGPNQPIVLTFSESLNSGDINNSNFVVYSEGSVIRPSVYYSANAQTVTLRGSWPSGQLMSVVVTDNVRDLSGNRMDDTVSLFTSAVIDIDTGRPSVARQYPANGSSGVTAERVVLYTNEPMNEATLPGAFYVAQNGVLKEGSLSVSGAGQALVFTPTEPFAENALIHVYLDSTARDDSGNRVNSYQGSFRTASTTTAGVWPKPTGYSPYGNQNGVVVNPKIQVRYDQPLEPSSVVGQVSLRNSDTGSVIPSTISVVGDGYVLQVEPEVLLESDTRYYISLGSDITDTDGDRQVYGYSSYFYTGADNVEDDQAPQVIALSPPDGSLDVPLNPLYHVRYDEPVNTLSFPRQPGMGVRFAAGNREVLYYYHEPLEADSTHQEVVPEVVDLAGNAAQPAETVFHVGMQPDVHAPGYSYFVPSSNETVPVNSTIRIVMNEVVDPVSVTNGRVYVEDTDNGWRRVPGQVGLEPDGRTLVWTPDEALLVSRRYYLRVNDIADLSDNKSSSTGFYFNTSAQADVEAPEIVETTVFEGQAGVPVNARIRVRFNEPVDRLSLEQITLRQSGQALPIQRYISNDRRIVTLVPKELLPAQTALLFTIDGVQDLAGNALVAPHTVGFVTESGVDVREGSLKTYSPVSNASNVPLNAVVEFWLSERIDPVLFDTGRVYLHNQTENRRVAVDLSLLDDGRRVRMTPREPLKAGHQYDARLSYGTYLYDLSGNRVGYYNRFTFTTSASADEVAPEVVSHNLTEDLGSVALNAPVAVTVNEPLNSLCVKTDTVSLSDGVSTISGSVSLSSDRRTVVFTPSQVLDAQTAYTLTISGACDLSLQTLPDYTLSFTTGTSTDTSGPRVSSITPAHRSTDVPVDTTITVVFNEPIDARTIGRTIVRTSAGAISGSWSVSGATAVFTPANALPGGTKVDVQVRNVLDPVGNSGGYQYYDFRTAL